MPARAVLVALVFSVSSPAFADCREPETGTKKSRWSNDGWSSVMYSNPKTGNHVSGWVKSSRLRATGTVGH
jgi:hypothetical protein